MAQVERVTEVREEREPASSAVIMARIVNLIFAVIITFILLRVVLMLLAANTGNAFTDLIYGVSGIFVAPFYGIFNYTPVYGSSVLDMSALTAVVVYALLGWGIAKLVTIGSSNRHVAA
jgi:YggT family protein